MKDIAIYGAGGFGREIACLIGRINDSHSEPIWNFIGFFDDGVEKGFKISHFGTILGGMDDLNQWNTELDIAVAIGNPNTVKSIVEKIINPLVNYPNLIAPDVAIIDPETFCIGKGNILKDHCSFSCDVSIGDFNVFNGSDFFGHDAEVGNFNCFMPSIRVSGEVKVGDFNFFGVGSIILQQIKIGNNIKVGAGAVLMTKPKDGNLYIGNPAKKFKI